MSEEARTAGGVGFWGLLGILFIGLKLAGFISWPWVWVLAPLWIPLALTLVCVCVCLIVVLLRDDLVRF